MKAKKRKPKPIKQDGILAAAKPPSASKAQRVAKAKKKKMVKRWERG